MSIRRRIVIYFSLVITLLTGLMMILIFNLFSEYREDEFKQRQKEKITTTLRLLSQVREDEKDLVANLGQRSINALYNEKILIFNRQKMLIYSSVDDTPVSYSDDLLKNLSDKNPLIEKQDGRYDIVAAYIENSGNSYYGISKAYDKFGYSKLEYLKKILFFAFVILVITIILTSYYLSRSITAPILSVIEKIKGYDINKPFKPVEFSRTNLEVSQLARQFNILMKQLQEAFAFQKHTIHHISHELKTPVSILISNFERLEKEQNLELIRELLKTQKEDTRTLGEIINALLEISKLESGHYTLMGTTRVDELLFSIADELKNLYPDFSLKIDVEGVEQESDLSVSANDNLLKLAFTNLLVNCHQYGSGHQASVLIRRNRSRLDVLFMNKGELITPEEQKFLFQHFFRGHNSNDKRGFGLGLVFVKRIAELHGGDVHYHVINNDTNTFTFSLPLT
ncbi:MAG TPA: HAMP domain-containing sensor histidine kinase [Bacteroidia bacterium]|nr:HAMP domain-containing sensor histidine kinase [Bacteroidia bacterium]